MEYDQWEIEGYYFHEPNTLDPDHYYYKVSSPGALPEDELSDEETSPSQVWQGGIFVGDTPTPTASLTCTPTPTPKVPWRIVVPGATPRIAASINAEGELYVDGMVVLCADMDNLPGPVVHKTLDSEGQTVAAVYYNSAEDRYDLALKGIVHEGGTSPEPTPKYMKVVSGATVVASLTEGGLIDGDLFLKSNDSRDSYVYPAPVEVFEAVDSDIYTTPWNDIDMVVQGKGYTVCIKGLRGEYLDRYTFERKKDAGGYETINPTVDPDPVEREGVRFNEPDSVPLGHYYYRVTVATPEPEGDVIQSDDEIDDPQETKVWGEASRW